MANLVQMNFKIEILANFEVQTVLNLLIEIVFIKFLHFIGIPN